MDYFKLSKEQSEILKENFNRRESLLSEYASLDGDAIRRATSQKENSLYYRSNYIIDIERILNNPLYNRYADKTQVFSFYKNDDITRRAHHVQLVSRIARNIGAALGLNLELIEAIALGHDIGHTPFGHEGERMLSRLYNKFNKSFNHNVHSVKILDTITNKDRKHSLCLQTLDGIICHNGEKVHECYEPSKPLSIDEFDERYEACYYDENIIKTMRPFTLEGCVVRVSDVIAYIGKDRQDLFHTKQQHLYNRLENNEVLGKSNSDFVSRLTANIIKNSIGKNYIGFDTAVYEALDKIRQDNFNVIYKPDGNEKVGMDIAEEMAKMLFEKFYSDILCENRESSVHKHYLDNTIFGWSYDKENKLAGRFIQPEDIVIDYMASMTDDYFIEIFEHYFPNDELVGRISYVPYDPYLK